MSAASNQKVTFPFAVESRSGSPGELAAMVESARDELECRLLESGAVLFRGFGINNVSEFESFVRKFARKDLLRYTGGASPRVGLEKAGVYTSTEYPAAITIPLHNELSYTSKYPDHIYFYCEVPPGRGGETTLGDSRRILKKMSPLVRETFRQKKVMYERRLDSQKGSGYSWQDAFGTEDRSDVESWCESAGARIEWKGDLACVSEVRPATAVHPRTGEEVWFNQADGFHISTVTGAGCRSFEGETPRLQSYFGDGTPICIMLLNEIRSVIETETIKHDWQRGDILVLDNRLAAHGRMPFEGDRKIAVAMT